MELQVRQVLPIYMAHTKQIQQSQLKKQKTKKKKITAALFMSLLLPQLPDQFPKNPMPT